MMGKLIHGHALAAHPKTACEPTPHVTLKRLGSDDPFMFFSPDEARTFGVAIIDASEQAEGGC
jgi:hypothetical protein